MCSLNGTTQVCGEIGIQTITTQYEMNETRDLKHLDCPECLSQSFLECSIYVWIEKKWTICFLKYVRNASCYTLIEIQSAHQYAESS